MVVHRDVRESVDAALAERRRIRLDSTKIRVVTAADGFVAGEASAVVNWVGRAAPIPLGKAPRMTERGLQGRPTLVQNVETLAHLGLVGRHGADWFRQVGTADEPGTMLVTLAGSLVTPGVFEVAIGTPTSDVLELAGGPSAPIQALLIGGYFGTWIPAPAALSAPFSTERARGRTRGRPGRGPSGRRVRRARDGAARPLSGVAIRRPMWAVQVRAPGDCRAAGTAGRRHAGSIRRLDAMGRRDRGSGSMWPPRWRCPPHSLGPRRLRSRGFGAPGRALLGP